MKWVRLYNATANDPNWRMIAADTGLPVHAVLAAWTAMLCHASEATPRGTLAGWMDKRAAAILDLKPADLTAIREAMQGVTLDGDRLLNWDQEQYESDTSAERTRVYRERKKQRDRNVTPSSRNGDETSRNDDVTSRDGDVTSPPLRATDNRYQNKEPPLRGVNARERARGDDPDFETWWSAYPHKVGKGAARKAFQAARPKAPFGDLLQAVQRYERFLKQPGAPHACHPATWLNQERWTDELPEVNHEQHRHYPRQGTRRGGAAALAADLEQEFALGADDRHGPGGYGQWGAHGGSTVEGTCRRVPEDAA